MSKTYTYATDSASGTVVAESLITAYYMLAVKIFHEQIADGATLWVEDKETGDRLTMGRDGMMIAS